MSNTQPPPPEGSGDDPNPSGMPQYPNAPQMPPVDQPQRRQVPQPSSVRTAVRLMWVGAAISVIGLIISFASLSTLKSQIRDQLESSGQKVTQNMVDTGYTTGIVTMILFGVVGALLWLWMSWKNGQGRRWARIVATVFAALNLIGTVSSFARGSATTAALVVQLVGLLVGLVVVVLLWRKESTEFFNAGRQTAG